MRWSREERARELAAIGQGVRGYKLCASGEILACVAPANRAATTWYWYTMEARPFKNTAFTPTDLDTAKAQAVAHVKAWLAGKISE